MKKITQFLNKQRLMRKDYIKIILFYTSIISIFYIRSLAGYFQGDEWFYFSQLLPYTKVWYGPFSVIYNSLVDTQKISGGAHLTPISFFLYYLNILFFRFTYWPYALCALFLHITNSFLIFLFIRQLFPKKGVIAWVGGIFFACSFIHYQAVVWVMTYIWTGLAVTFFLLCLIQLLNYLKNNSIKSVTLSSVFLLCALLTKESTVVLFVMIPLVIFLKKGFYIKRIFFFTYGLCAFVYVMVRFILPVVFIKIGLSTPPSTVNKLDVGLSLFRIIIYPLKMLVEVFVPDKIILWIAEFITPLSYPSYAAEKAIRGTNYLTFVQGAGSDMVIYAIAMIFLAVISIVFYQSVRNKNFESRNALVIGFFIIVLTAVPLVSIATYSPGWGYVTFIDSRHIYLASVGGSVLFAMAIYALAHFISLFVKNIIFINSFLLLLCILSLWLIPNFIFLQNQFTFLNTLAMQRKKVIEYLSLTLPPLDKEQTIVMKSDTGYYGFGPIPPFQTNFGQVLEILYFDKNMLPKEFMQSDSLTKAGLNGEGVETYHDKTFGYFIQDKTAVQAVLDKKIQPQNVYSFYWHGKDNEIGSDTAAFQDVLNQRLKYDVQYANWKLVKINSYQLSFRIPPDFKLIPEESVSADVPYRSIIFSENNPQQYELFLHKKNLNKGTFEDVSFLQNSDGEIIGTDFYYRNIILNDGEELVTKLPSKGNSMQYFIPTILTDYIIEFRVLDNRAEFDKKDTLAETMISFVRYQK